MAAPVLLVGVRAVRRMAPHPRSPNQAGSGVLSELDQAVCSNAEELTAAAGSRDLAEVARVADVLLAVDDRALASGDPATIRALLDAAERLSQVGDLTRAEWLLIKGLNA